MTIDEKTLKRIEQTLKIAADNTRLKILFSLLDELDKDHEVEKCVNDISVLVSASQSLVSHQLKVLKDGGFVKTRKEGKKIYYSLADEHVREIIRITHEHVVEKDYD